MPFTDEMKLVPKPEKWKTKMKRIPHEYSERIQPCLYQQNKVLNSQGQGQEFFCFCWLLKCCSCWRQTTTTRYFTNVHCFCCFGNDNGKVKKTISMLENYSRKNLMKINIREPHTMGESEKKPKNNKIL